jgi:hypothetical protein
MTFDYISNLCENLLDNLESSDYDILSYKVFQGENRIKVELIRFNNDFNPIIKITSLEDPNITGYSEYSSKIESIQAFNNITSMEKLIKYMNHYSNEPDSLKWAIILQDEGEEIKKSPAGGESGMVSASSPGGMFESPTASPAPEAGMPPGTEQPAGMETPPAMPETAPVATEVPAEPAPLVPPPPSPV